MPQVDSLDKIFESYFAAVTKVEIEWRGKVFKPKPLRVSDGIYRSLPCPAKCGACCQRFSLDYIPHVEKLPKSIKKQTKKRLIQFRTAGELQNVYVRSYMQDGSEGHFCDHLDMESGRCGIHGRHPFTCDFEHIRFQMTGPKVGANRVTTRTFGRGWAMKRIDGERGALCDHTLPVSKEFALEAARKLRRLLEWAEHFKIPTCLPEVIDWVATGPHSEPQFFNQEFDPANQGHEGFWSV